MSINVYFLDKTVSFRTEIGQDEHFDAIVAADSTVTRAKVLKILESCNRLAVLSAQPQTAFKLFSKEFTNVNAAGGVVTNPQGEVLMMYRRGRWDLPKGHIELGEQPNQCAHREVAEETGIAKTKVHGALCSTYHAYDLYGRWELKRTQWFAMSCDGSETPVPQHEEGIEAVKWVPRSAVGECLQKSYPTIREVMDNFYKR